MKQSLLSLLLVLTFVVSCNRVTSPDGTVPAEYLEIAKNYTGDYSGKFSGTKGTLRITLDGNRPVAQFIGADGSDDITGNSHCAAVIGRLVAITPQKKNNITRVGSAEFSFDAPRCPRIMGRTLTLDFKHNGATPTSLSASVLEEHVTEWREICHFDQWGRQYCNRTPWDYDRYLSGSFKR